MQTKNVFRSMMRAFVLSAVFILFGSGIVEAGQKIVAVQSSRLRPYEQALEGFKSICNGTVKRVIISELKKKSVAEKVTSLKPDMVLAIGIDALRQVKQITHLPIVYILVPNPGAILSEEKNITGVSMKIFPGKQLFALLDIMPDLKTIGLVYDPDKTGGFVKEVEKAARLRGRTLLTRTVDDPRDVAGALLSMKGSIDAFWMLPDVTVVTPETVELMMLYSIENRIPILSFSEKYVELGALLSIGIDARDTGCQAGELALQILSGNNDGIAKQVAARRTVVSINRKIVRNLELFQRIAGNMDTNSDERIVRKFLTVQ